MTNALTREDQIDLKMIEVYAAALTQMTAHFQKLPDADALSADEIVLQASIFADCIFKRTMEDFFNVIDDVDTLIGMR